MKAVVLGAGRMGQRHVQILQDMGIEVAGLVDRSKQIAQEVAADRGLTNTLVTADTGEAFGRLKADIAVVSTTAPSHVQYVVQAAEAGVRYILCEKPMAPSLEECDRMMAACSKNGTLLAINHQMRFMEQYTAVRELAESDTMGGLRSVTVVAGNFGLAMNGCHYFEMFRYLTSEAPAVVQARFSSEVVPNPRGSEFEDRAGTVFVTTATGKRFVLEAGSDQGHGVQVLYGCRYGQVHVNELTGSMTWEARQTEHRALPTTRYGCPADRGTTQIAPADVLMPSRSVLEALVGGRGYPDGRDGRLAVAALVAAYTSDERGHGPVSVDSQLPAGRRFPWA